MMIENNRGELLQGTANAISKLAVATASDCGTVAMPTATNAKLTKQCEEAQAYTKKIKQDIVEIKAKIKPTWQRQQPFKVAKNDNYCLLHGYQIHKDHTRLSFKAPKEGHKTEATKSYTMNGLKWCKE
jgi:hypothetical protein